MKKPTKKPKPLPKPSSEYDSSDDQLGALDPSAIKSLSSFFAQHEDPLRLAHNEKLKYMCGHVEEYLSNFILIGYTVNGNPVNVTRAKSQKDMDSLATALQKYVFECYTKYPPAPPGHFD